MTQFEDSTWQIKLTGPRLAKPVLTSNRWQTVYGYGSFMQVSPTQVAAIVNRRITGHAIVDFEDGTDAIICDHPDNLDARNAVALSRSEETEHPVTGRKLHTRCIMLTGGFVPLGALLPDGSPHPAAGTGFVFGGHGSCLAEPVVQPADKKNQYGFRELIQLRFDGQRLRVTGRRRFQGREIHPDYLRIGHGLSTALPDGTDLISGVVAGPVAPGDHPDSARIASEHPHSDARLGRNVGSCFCRWHYGRDGWYPAVIIPVTPPDLAMEPSLVRDRDGALLMAVRGKGMKEPPGCVYDGMENTYEHFRVYRSSDNVETWTRVLHLPRMRNATPVVLNRTAGGHPFITANPYQSGKDSRGRTIPSTHWRDKLFLWPLTEDRTDVEKPIVLLDANKQFGPARQNVARVPLSIDNVWKIDHPLANTVRLADGEWHCLLSFRVTDAAVNAGGADPSDQSGFWTARIQRAKEKPIPVWRF